ncbi:hypothetical protein DNTS_011843 [Danionella cerebrum]|uniref:Uncharacterized protein n=1 Tax=Danionella cerebrum TaxID=2873325 RepID=A0A553MWI1_9TELE|nr:hypothetical protein DNTS_011843 [Danionella translucida]
MATTVAVSPSEYLQPSNTTSQDSQPSPLALLAATCSKIGPPAAQAPVSTPSQPTPRRLHPIKPAPIAPAPPKNLGFLSAKGNIIQLPAGLGSSGASPIVFTIQSPTRPTGPSNANVQYQVIPQFQSPQTIQMMPQAGQIQIIPGTNQAIITSPMSVQAATPGPPPLAPASALIPQQKTVAIKPSPQKRRQNNVNTNVVQLPSGLTLPLNVTAGDVGGAQIITETAISPVKAKRGRKRQVAIAPPPAPQPASPPPISEQVETLLIETTADNIIQRHPVWASDVKPIRGTSPQTARRALHLQDSLFSKELENMGKHLAEVEKDLAKLAEQGKLKRSPKSPHRSLMLPPLFHSTSVLPPPQSPSSLCFQPTGTSRSNPSSRGQTPMTPMTPNSLTMRSLTTGSHFKSDRVYGRSRSRPVTPTNQITRPILTPPGLSTTDLYGGLWSTLTEDEFYQQLQAVRKPWRIPGDTEGDCHEPPEQDKCECYQL